MGVAFTCSTLFALPYRRRVRNVLDKVFLGNGRVCPQHHKMRTMHVKSLVHILSLRDVETEEHTHRVAAMTLDFARLMGIPQAHMEHVYHGALLHDLGKIGVPDHVLHKQGALTDAETTIVQMHPIYAYEVLHSIPYLYPALDIPYNHHEKWDGTGYPRGLCGKEIPLAARLFAIVDVWDAVLSDRPYRPAWSRQQAIEYLNEQSGTHFDPDLVPVFLKTFSLR